ncbi:MAG TPA: hypothetical protein PLU30_27310 [Verrucomicrobiae bacterium]|nr:hypothetical protein [Verrucomicrobiae bacterium]
MPLREEFCAICLDGKGVPDHAQALVLQQLQYRQLRVGDLAAYVEQENLRARRAKGGKTAGYFRATLGQLAEDLFHAISKSSVRRAVEALYQLGVLHIRDGRRGTDRAEDRCLDLVRLSALLLERGFALDPQWAGHGIDFAEAGAPEQAPGDPERDGSSMVQGEPSMIRPEPSTCSTGDHVDTEEISVTEENPLNPPGGGFFDFNFDPGQIQSWQVRSKELLPEKIGGAASMRYVRAAPVARIFEALPEIHRGPMAWEPGLARKFAKRVKAGLITVPRLLAGGFLIGEQCPDPAPTPADLIESWKVRPTDETGDWAGWWPRWRGDLQYFIQDTARRYATAHHAAVNELGEYATIGLDAIEFAGQAIEIRVARLNEIDSGDKDFRTLPLSIPDGLKCALAPLCDSMSWDGFGPDGREKIVAAALRACRETEALRALLDHETERFGGWTAERMGFSREQVEEGANRERDRLGRLWRICGLLRDALGGELGAPG